MEWTEITVKVKNADADAVCDVLQMVSNGLYIEDYQNLEKDVEEIAHTDLIEQELLEKDRENVIIHIYFSVPAAEITVFIKERLDELSITHEICVSKTDDTDWAERWKKYYKPFNVGKRLKIRPEWEECEPEGRTVLIIEPGLAFGTGTHETTKMCLELLDDYVKKGDTVLDVGCGSGVLGIAALLLGAEKTTAIDIDPLAVRIARSNGALNSLSEDRLVVLEGDLTDRLDKSDKFDIILANITAEPIIMLLTQLLGHLKENGVFICSGIIDAKLGSVINGMKANSLAPEIIREENGWAAIAAKDERYAKIFRGKS